MMTFAVQRLNDGIRATLMAHFLALPMKDRSLRFGRSLAPTVIAAYVDGIDFGRDAIFGVYDSQFMLIGEAHMAIRGRPGRSRALGSSGAPQPRCRQRAFQPRARTCAQPLHTEALHALPVGKCTDHTNRAEVRHEHYRERRRCLRSPQSAAGLRCRRSPASF